MRYHSEYLNDWSCTTLTRDFILWTIHPPVPAFGKRIHFSQSKYSINLSEKEKDNGWIICNTRRRKIETKDKAMSSTEYLKINCVLLQTCLKHSIIILFRLSVTTPSIYKITHEQRIEDKSFFERCIYPCPSSSRWIHISIRSISLIHLDYDRNMVVFAINDVAIRGQAELLSCHELHMIELLRKCLRASFT